MRWSNQDIDQLFRNAETRSKFVYNTSYFRDIERQLPLQHSRRSFTGWMRSFGTLFILCFFLFARIADETQFTTNFVKMHSVVRKRFTTDTVKSQGAISLAEQFRLGADSEDENSDITANFEIPTLTVSNDLKEPHEVVYISDSSNEFFSLNFRGLNQPCRGDGEIIEGRVSKFERNSELRWFVRLDRAAQQAWTNETGGLKINSSVGIMGGFDKRFANWRLSAGVSFIWQNLKSLEIRERTKIYGFGYATYDNAYSFTGIASLSLPFSLGYNVGRHEFGAGFEAGRNLFASLKRVQSINGEVLHLTQGITDISLLSGFSLQPEVHYAYYLNQRVAVGASFKYQLIHPLSSDRFEGKQVEHPWSFGLYVKSSLIK